MNKFFVVGSIVLVIIFVLSIINPFLKNQEQVVSTPVIKTTLPPGGQKIEIFAFHATQRCTSCVNVGKYTQEVVSQKFAKEMALEKIIFKEINIDLSENRQLTEDYRVSASSLYITVTKDGQIFREEDTDVWRYVAYETKFKDYFEAKLRQLL